jgi:D-alanine-D-alanine ligase
VEHEVSVDSARSVAVAMRSSSLECVPIGVTGDGRWLPRELSQSVLDSDAARVEPGAGQDDGARVVIDPGGGRLLSVARDGGLQPVALDVVFPLIHGWGGEDGRVQGALDLALLPYVGSGVCASAVAMDKVLARQLLDSQGIPGTRWIAFEEGAHRRGADTVHRRITTELDFPVFVKPANGGSSVGISRVDGVGGLPTALQTAFDCDTKVIVEQGIDAREIECAVIGNEEAQASVLGEIIPSGEFYDYAAKYEDGASELIIPADLEPEVAKTIRAHALSAYGCLGLSGLARVDFLLDRSNGQVYLNEVNTLPGFTSISMFPKLWEATGLPYPSLVERLVDLALERSRS